MSVPSLEASAGLAITIPMEIRVTMARQHLGLLIGADCLAALVLVCNRARDNPKLQRSSAPHWGPLNPRRAHRTSSTENPSTAIHLRRLLWPRTSATLLGATPSRSETNRRNDSLAAPSTGGAVRRITTASSLSPTTSLRRLRGRIHRAMLSLAVIHPIQLPPEDSICIPQR
jgi:hypothetical protein